MARPMTVARIAVLAAAIAVSQTSVPAASAISGDIHWVEGTVSASSPTSLSVTAGDRCLVLKMDSSTAIVGAARRTDGRASIPIPPGTTVRAHFRTSDGKVAVVVVDTAAAPGQPAKREGTSVRGEVQRVRPGSVSVRFDRGTRDLVFDDRTSLVDRDGRARATGAKSIGPLLAAGTDVLITWVAFRATDAEGAVSSTYRRALEIRTLN